MFLTLYIAAYQRGHQKEDCFKFLFHLVSPPYVFRLLSTKAHPNLLSSNCPTQCGYFLRNLHQRFWSKDVMGSCSCQKSACSTKYYATEIYIKPKMPIIKCKTNKNKKNVAIFDGDWRSLLPKIPRR
jgi:hypothetical protein